MEKCTCQYPGAWSIGLAPLNFGKIRDKYCSEHGDEAQQTKVTQEKSSDH
jgi:hypothetical protein